MRSDANEITDERSHPACTPAQLASWLADETARPLVIDVRWALGAPSSYPDYLAGHVPTAVWADLDADFADPPAADRQGGRHPLPDPGRLEPRLRHWGLRAADSVVTYDAADSIAAARAWWVLRWAGLRPRDGLGRRRGGLGPGRTAVGPGARIPDSRRGLSRSTRVRWRPSTRRAPPSWPGPAGWSTCAQPLRFRGDEEPVDPVAGHIPGARNVPAGELDEGGRTIGRRCWADRAAGGRERRPRRRVLRFGRDRRPHGVGPWPRSASTVSLYRARGATGSATRPDLSRPGRKADRPPAMSRAVTPAVGYVR
jgi:thiosulfate/3-mercaptopyruvate sulfurtransferase